MSGANGGAPHPAKGDFARLLAEYKALAGKVNELITNMNGMAQSHNALADNVVAMKRREGLMYNMDVELQIHVGIIYEIVELLAAQVNNMVYQFHFDLEDIVAAHKNRISELESLTDKDEAAVAQEISDLNRDIEIYQRSMDALTTVEPKKIIQAKFEEYRAVVAVCAGLYGMHLHFLKKAAEMEAAEKAREDELKKPNVFVFGKQAGKTEAMNKEGKLDG